MISFCQVCRARPAMCEQIKNGKRTKKCELCREGRVKVTLKIEVTVKRIIRTRRI